MSLPRFLRRVSRVFTNPPMRIVDFGAAERRLPAPARPFFRLADRPGYVLLEREAKRPARAGGADGERLSAGRGPRTRPSRR